MTDFKHMSEADVSRLLVGDVPPGADGAESVAAFVGELRTADPEQAVPVEVEEAHVAAMVAAAQRLAAGGDRAPRPSGKGRTLMRLTVKIAVSSVAFVLLFGGLALAGTLPDSVQDPISRAASAIGIPIARPSPEPTVAPAHEVASPTASPSPTAKAHRSAAPPHTHKPRDKDGQAQTGTPTTSGSQQDQSTADEQDNDSPPDTDEDRDPPAADDEQDPGDPDTEGEPPEVRDEPPELDRDPPEDDGEPVD